MSDAKAIIAVGRNEKNDSSHFTRCVRCGRADVLYLARGLCWRCYRDYRHEHPATKTQRPYTAAERELIRRDWNRRRPAEIAAELGRCPRALYAAATQFGVCSTARRQRRVTAATKRRILALHAQGLSNREIGRRARRGHVTVSRVLAAAGLRSNCRASNRDSFPARWRQQIGELFRERIESEGLFDTMACLRRLIPERAEAVRMGWHQANTLLEAKILEFLWRNGPHDVDAICNGVGRVSHWCRLVVRTMRNRGLLANRSRRGHWVIYGLADGIAPTPPAPARKLKASEVASGHQRVLSFLRAMLA